MGKTVFDAPKGKIPFFSSSSVFAFKQAIEQMLFQLLVSIPWKISGFGIRIVALLLFSLLLFALSLFAITLFSLCSLLFHSFALHSIALRSFTVHSFAQNRSNYSRVGHRVLLHSEHIFLLRSFEERNVLLCSFFEFLATYETQKMHSFAFFS